MKDSVILDKWDEISLLIKKGTPFTKIADFLIEKYEIKDRTREMIRKSISKKVTREKLKEQHHALANECDDVGIPLEDVKYYWYKGQKFSINVRNDNEVDYVSAIGDVINSHSFQKRKLPTVQTNGKKAIKATLSDMHVGLDPNPDNKSLFGYEYNAEIFNEHIDKVINSVVKEYDSNGAFDLLLIDDLGDGLDGYNKLTTRGGHELEQNMSNEEAFKTYVSGKLKLIETLIDMGVARKYQVRNVGACNHAGSFGRIANTAIKMILDRVYEKEVVDFYILERFMEHFDYGVHTFILTHGKDDKYMFKGLPYTLNDKTIAFINDYIDHYGITNRHIHVEKGDLHRVGYDRTKKFDYRNFMSFAPPSAWVQGNFGDGYSGYSVQIIPKDNGEIQHTDYYFDLKKRV